jgi:Flp pilus assembly protein TadD
VEAYSHLQRLQKIDPESAIGNTLMARYWFKQKKYEEARNYAEKVKLIRPANSELRSLLGNIYLDLGQKEKAREEYEAAVRLAPDRVDFRAQLEKVK